MPANPAPSVLSSSALVLAQPSPAPPVWLPSMAHEATPALGPSVITCFNCGKAGHKYPACPEPHKPGAIHKIDEQGQESDIMDATGDKSGKEDA